MKYGVFTVSMPEYDVEETAKILSDLGYDGVEWRVFDVIDPSKALDEKAAKSLERFGFDPKSADLAESLSTSTIRRIPAILSAIGSITRARSISTISLKKLAVPKKSATAMVWKSSASPVISARRTWRS